MYLPCTSESYPAPLDERCLTLPEWFRLCAEELGLTAVELEDRHIGEPTAGGLAEVREAAARYGLEIVNIAFMNNFGVADDGRRQMEQERTARWMQVSKELGTRSLRTFAGWPEGDRQVRWPSMLAALRVTATAAERAGGRLVLENHNHGGFVQTADDLEAIPKAVYSPALGLLLNSGNFLDGLASIRRTAGLTWHVHAKFKRVGPDGRDARVDHDAVLAYLRGVGYTGCISVEYEGEEPGSTAVPRAVAYLRQVIVM